jgi:mannan endo-1,4-beta-mannosidase
MAAGSAVKSAEFVSVAGTRFALKGHPYPVVGTNCYYLGYCPPEHPEMIDSVLDAADAFSLNVLRIWAFLDMGSGSEAPPAGMFGACYQYFDTARGRPTPVDGDQGLRRLDRAVHAAGARGYRLILALTNSLPDFGGMDRYLEWLTKPGEALYHDDFYEREDVAAAYQNWVAHILERTNSETGLKYKDDPAILAWELANEPRCTSHKGLPARGDCARSQRILRWVERMSAFVKSIDTNHLVTVGDEGFFNRRFSCNPLYNGSYGVHCEAMLRLPNIDFGTYHLYPQSWGQTDRGFGLKWIEQHAKAARKIQKPMLLEEFGLQTGVGFVRDAAERDAIYAEWLRAAAADGPGSLFWMLAGVEGDGQRFRHPDQFCMFEPAESPAILAHARALGTGGEAIAV